MNMAYMVIAEHDPDTASEKATFAGSLIDCPSDDNKAKEAAGLWMSAEIGS